METAQEDVKLQQPLGSELLRPQQLVEMEAEKRSLEESLADPNNKKKGNVKRQLVRLEKMLHVGTPLEPVGKEKDFLVKKAKESLDELKQGMLTQEELRRCPPGAAHHLLQWEKKNRRNVQVYKHCMLRLNAGTSDPDVANLEKHRPTGIGNRMFSLDQGIVSTKQIHLPDNLEIKNTMSDEERAEATRNKYRDTLRVLEELGVNIGEDELAAIKKGAELEDEALVEKPKKKKKKKDKSSD